LWLGDGPVDVDCLLGYLTFEVEDSDYYRTGKPPFGHLGVIFYDADWEIEHPECSYIAMNDTNYAGIATD
jgi:hypothetical protein